MYDLRTHAEADIELDEALRYLSERTLWQATRFADALHTALKQIRTRPEGSHFVWREFRRYNINGFSYALIYRQQGREVFVIAVMHQKRHPDYWKHRIEDDSNS